MDAQVTLAFIGLLLDKGAPAVIKIIKAMEVENPTVEDIRRLHDLVKRPEDYLKD